MSTFTITSSVLSSQYTYKNEDVIVNGNFQKNAQTDALTTINGTAWRNNDGQQGEYIGNFNGNMNNGVVKYSLSEMSRRDSNLVWDAIDEIEANITRENSNSEI